MTCRAAWARMMLFSCANEYFNSQISRERARRALHVLEADVALGCQQFAYRILQVEPKFTKFSERDLEFLLEAVLGAGNADAVWRTSGLSASVV